MSDEEPSIESAPFDISAPIVIGDRVIEHHFAEDIRIEGGLDAAARRQAELFANYGMLAVEARHRERQLKLEYDRVVAGVEYELRERMSALAPAVAKAGGAKVPRVNAAQIKAAAQTDERVRRKEAVYLAAQREADKLTMFEEALRQRAGALMILDGERRRRESR